MPSQKRSFEEALEENEDSENEINNDEQPKDEDGRCYFSYLNHVTVFYIFL